ncbi:hypothetical protein L596_006225 [Steinernema carpocapsae]|uniref:Uncharacterized protein n=1 Tax=Steinernema carpocapsae TaxID=34508 RepID=A0A4U8V2Z7_STECR|nr:hypothetical protein L596_006225 [Steinernema carpocapsae]
MVRTVPLGTEADEELPLMRSASRFSQFWHYCSCPQRQPSRCAECPLRRSTQSRLWIRSVPSALRRHSSGTECHPVRPGCTEVLFRGLQMHEGDPYGSFSPGLVPSGEQSGETL